MASWRLFLKFAGISASVAEIPERLKRGGRPADQEFSREERLFRRGTIHHPLDSEGFVLPPGVPFPDLSVNREKYSEPEDVLIGYPVAVGVAAAVVGDIPGEIDGYELLPIHDPEEANYAHTEVRAFREGKRTQRKPPSSVRKAFRLSFRLKVLP